MVISSLGCGTALCRPGVRAFALPSLLLVAETPKWLHRHDEPRTRWEPSGYKHDGAPGGVGTSVASEPSSGELKQDLLDDTRAALRLTELLEQQWLPDAGPPQERLEEVARQDIVLEISGRLLCIEHQLVELFSGVRGEWRDGPTEEATDMPYAVGASDHR